MSEKIRFHNMTKPMKFRRLKMAKQFNVSWYKAVRDVIKYKYNYILYKLNILKRYNYRDSVEQVISSPYVLVDKVITTDYFSATVKMQLASIQEIDVDYFYYVKKNASSKVTLIVKDSNEERLFAFAHLENINIKVGSEWYNVDNLPTFKMASIINNSDRKSVLDKPIEEPRVVEYDITKLKSFTHKLLIGVLQPSDISEAMYRYFYDCACDEVSKYLGNLTLADIMK